MRRTPNAGVCPHGRDLPCTPGWDSPLPRSQGPALRSKWTSHRRDPLAPAIHGGIAMNRWTRVPLLTVVCALFVLAGISSASAATLSPTPNPLPGSTFQGGDGDELNP